MFFLQKKGPLTEEAIEEGGYAAVLLVDETVGFQLRANEACRRAGSAFVSASSRGAFASLFCDFGDRFVVEDQDGEEPLVRERGEGRGEGGGDGTGAEGRGEMEAEIKEGGRGDWFYKQQKH